MRCFRFWPLLLLVLTVLMWPAAATAQTSAVDVTVSPTRVEGELIQVEPSVNDADCGHERRAVWSIELRSAIGFDRSMDREATRVELDFEAEVAVTARDVGDCRFETNDYEIAQVVSLTVVPEGDGEIFGTGDVSIGVASWTRGDGGLKIAVEPGTYRIEVLCGDRNSGMFRHESCVSTGSATIVVKATVQGPDLPEVAGEIGPDPAPVLGLTDQIVLDWERAERICDGTVRRYTSEGGGKVYLAERNGDVEVVARADDVEGNQAFADEDRCEFYWESETTPGEPGAKFDAQVRGQITAGVSSSSSEWSFNGGAALIGFFATVALLILFIVFAPAALGPLAMLSFAELSTLVLLGGAGVGGGAGVIFGF